MKSDSFERKIDDEKVEGWKVKEDGDERVVMHKPNYGSLGAHVLVLLLTVWFTAGLGNVAYAAYCYFKKSPTKVVRDDQAGQTKRQRESGAEVDAQFTPEEPI